MVPLPWYQKGNIKCGFSMLIWEHILCNLNNLVFSEYNILCNSKNKNHLLRNTYFKSFFMITRHRFQRKISSFYSKMQILIFFWKHYDDWAIINSKMKIENRYFGKNLKWVLFAYKNSIFDINWFEKINKFPT